MANALQATQVANEKARPRIVYIRDFDNPTYTAAIKAEAGTFDWFYRSGDAALAEWDVVFATHELDQLWKLPDHLAIFCVIDDKIPNAGRLLPTSAGGAPATNWLRWTSDIRGNEVRIPHSLPEDLRNLVVRDLVKVADVRYRQSGLTLPGEPTDALPFIRDWRPFLVGPENLVLGASMIREGGAPLWILPSDVRNIGDWLKIALDEWSIAKPKVFPNRAVWSSDPRWMSGPEAELHSELARAAEALQSAKTLHGALLANFDSSLVTAREADTQNRRALLTSDAEELQNAVMAALLHLGFRVRDMDLEWPDDARLEDYRITDADQDGWLALGDATGTVNGAKYSKFGALQTHAMKSAIREDWKVQPRLWLIVNQLRHRAPDARGPLFTDDEAALIADAGGLALDTAALFTLLKWSDDDPAKKIRVRDWLVSTSGQVGLADAKAWIEDCDQSEGSSL